MTYFILSQIINMFLSHSVSKVGFVALQPHILMNSTTQYIHFSIKYFQLSVFSSIMLKIIHLKIIKKIQQKQTNSICLSLLLL